MLSPIPPLQIQDQPKATTPHQPESTEHKPDSWESYGKMLLYVLGGAGISLFGLYLLSSGKQDTSLKKTAAQDTTPSPLDSDTHALTASPLAPGLATTGSLVSSALIAATVPPPLNVPLALLPLVGLARAVQPPKTPTTKKSSATDETTAAILKINDIRVVTLYSAIDSDNLENLENLLKSGMADPNAVLHYPDGTLDLPLPHAILAQKHAAARILVKHGAHVNESRGKGHTPLHYACDHKGDAQEETAMVVFLLEHGANPNSAEKSGITPLILASRTGLVGAIDPLLRHGAKLDAMNMDKVTALDNACFMGHAVIAAKLLAAGANPNIPDKDGHTALTFAVDGANPIPTLEALLNAKESSKLNLNWQDKGGVTPIYLSSNKGNAAATTMLLAAHADPEIKDNQGITCLMTASNQGREEVVDVLLAHHVRVNEQDDNGDTAVFHAAGGGYTGIVTKLRKAGANLDTPNKARVTPLSSSAGRGDLKMFRHLLAEGASLYVVHPEEGMNLALSRAVALGQPGMVSEILTIAPQLAFEKSKGGNAWLTTLDGWLSSPNLTNPFMPTNTTTLPDEVTGIARTTVETMRAIFAETLATHTATETQKTPPVTPPSATSSWQTIATAVLAGCAGLAVILGLPWHLYNKHQAEQRRQEQLRLQTKQESDRQKLQATTDPFLAGKWAIQDNTYIFTPTANALTTTVTLNFTAKDQAEFSNGMARIEVATMALLTSIGDELRKKIPTTTVDPATGSISVPIPQEELNDFFTPANVRRNLAQKSDAVKKAPFVQALNNWQRTIGALQNSLTELKASKTAKITPYTETPPGPASADQTWATTFGTTCAKFPWLKPNPRALPEENLGKLGNNREDTELRQRIQNLHMQITTFADRYNQISIGLKNLAVEFNTQLTNTETSLPNLTTLTTTLTRLQQNLAEKSLDGAFLQELTATETTCSTAQANIEAMHATIATTTRGIDERASTLTTLQIKYTNALAEFDAAVLELQANIDAKKRALKNEEATQEAAEQQRLASLRQKEERQRQRQAEKKAESSTAAEAPAAAAAGVVPCKAPLPTAPEPKLQAPRKTYTDKQLRNIAASLTHADTLNQLTTFIGDIYNRYRASIDKTTPPSDNQQQQIECGKCHLAILGHLLRAFEFMSLWYPGNTNPNLRTLRNTIMHYYDDILQKPGCLLTIIDAFRVGPVGLHIRQIYSALTLPDDGGPVDKLRKDAALTQLPALRENLSVELNKLSFGIDISSRSTHSIRYYKNQINQLLQLFRTLSLGKADMLPQDFENADSDTHDACLMLLVAIGRCVEESLPQIHLPKKTKRTYEEEIEEKIARLFTEAEKKEPGYERKHRFLCACFHYRAKFGHDLDQDAPLVTDQTISYADAPITIQQLQFQVRTAHALSNIFTQEETNPGQSPFALFAPTPQSDAGQSGAGPSGASASAGPSDIGPMIPTRVMRS